MAKALSVCIISGCPKIATHQGRCSDHARQETQPRQQWRHINPNRGTRHERGYTNSWARIAREAIANQPWCSRCYATSDRMAASEAELRRGWWQENNPNWRVRYLASPDKLRKMASIYARRTGV